MKTVFVDTSGFIAVLNPSDPFCTKATELFARAEREQWTLQTTGYVVHETWSLIQRRLGLDALEAFLDVHLPMCHVEFVDALLHHAGAARCRSARERHLSLTDCVSIEYMRQHGIAEAIASDVHFDRANIRLP